MKRIYRKRKYFHALETISRLSDFNIAFSFTNEKYVIIIIIIWSRCARTGESENTLSVQRPQPHTTNLRKEVEDKIVGDTKERADDANRKALALLLKPSSLTPSNTGSLR